MPRLLGIDLGTTSFKAVVYDEHGTALASSRVSPPDEQILVDGFRVSVWRPEKLWSAMCELIRRAVDALPDSRLDALAVAELGLVGYPVDSSGNALYAGVTWIDPAAQPSRAFSGCRIDNAALFSSTGNHLSPILRARYGAMVECWRLRCVPAVRRDGPRLFDGLANHSV